MDKVNVIYRNCNGEITAFFPDFPANYGNITCYAHIGQHGESCMEYYWKSKKALPDDYKALHEELSNIYSDCELIVKQKMNYDKLRKNWR